MQGIPVTLVYHLAGLPYRPVFEAWNAHVPGCEACVNGMALASLFWLERTPDRLCPVGAPLDVALREAIEAQHDISRNN